MACTVHVHFGRTLFTPQYFRHIGKLGIKLSKHRVLDIEAFTELGLPGQFKRASKGRPFNILSPSRYQPARLSKGGGFPPLPPWTHARRECRFWDCRIMAPKGRKGLPNGTQMHENVGLGALRIWSEDGSDPKCDNMCSDQLFTMF